MGEARASRPNNLPIQLTSFIGRTGEIAEITHLLASTRLLTLTGAGGCGKTRLALQVASSRLPNYAEGIWVVDLAALSDPAFVPQTVASALGVPEQPGRPPVDSLIDAVHPKSLLLLLDNCEHLLDACGQLVDALLRNCPDLRILTTSRERLGIWGEVAYRVPSLSVPDSEHLPSLEELTRYEAACLFIERARYSHPKFRVTSRNLPAIVQLCNRLDGIPLAIEMAAARVTALSVEQIVARLDDRFGLLTGRSRTALPRHQTLRATMDWSYDLLSEKERTLLRRLSVFAGGFTLEAIEAVCTDRSLEPSEIVGLLSQLVDKSLVQVEIREGEARYTQLETIRQYGRAQLEGAGDTAEIRKRHLDWYLALAVRAEPELHGPNQIAWLERLEENHDNLRAALESSRTEAGREATGLSLAAALSDFWDIRNHFAEGRAWLDVMLSLHAEAAPALRIRALTCAARLTNRLGDHARVAALCREALALSQAEGDERGSPGALHYLAHAAEEEGDYRQARDLLEHSAALLRAAGIERGLAASLNCLANVVRGEGDYQKAATLLTESVALFHSVGDHRAKAIALHNFGYVAVRQGDDQQARALFRESLALAKELGDKRMILKCLGGLAGASAHATPEWAAKLFGAAASLMSAASVRQEPVNRSDFDYYMSAAKGRLSERVFGTAFTRGATMTLDQAMSYALATKGAVTLVGTTVNNLTPREREVTSLIARGLTNRAIASRLIIAERTVDAHVEHILNKLGFHSRTQIAAWAVEHGFHPSRLG